MRTLPLPFDAEPTEHIEPSELGDCSVIAPGLSQTTRLAPADHGGLSQTTRLAPADHGGLSQTTRLAPAAQLALMAQLNRDVKRIEVAGRVQPSQLGRRSVVLSTGCGAMDDCLPSGGYESGTVIEYLQNSAGSGATTLALSAARLAMSATNRYCVVVDWRQQFYPPAAAALGLDLKRIVIVRPTSLADRLWAIDQALRSPAIAAVIAEVEQLDDRAARRLQLAAECGGGLALLVRGAQRSQPSWAEIQWLVKPLVQIAPASENRSQPHRQLQIELLRVRGGQSGAQLGIQINAVSGQIERIPKTPNAATIPNAATATLTRTLSQPAVARPAAKLA